jgi:hypothetical protein
MTALALHSAHLVVLATVLAAGGHHGGRAWAWILGWLIMLAVIVGVIVYLARRRRRPHDHPGGRAGQPR